MKKTNLIMLSDHNELVGQFKTDVQHILHSELKVLLKPEKQNSLEYLTRADVAERLHCSFSTIHRLVNNGGLKAYKLGRRTLFRSTDVEIALIKINTKGEYYAY